MSTSNISGIFMVINVLVCILLVAMPILCFCWLAKMRVRRKMYQQGRPAPVVVVSEQHTSAGPYPVTVQHHHTTAAGNVTAQTYTMPVAQPGMPMPGNYGPYPGATAAPYPTSNAPYPGMGMPQPVGGGVMPMPMPPNPATMNPPSYQEVVGNEAYQKQAPYNPNFSS